MRVVHVLSSLSRRAGGLFYAVSGLARAQQKLGMDVTVVGVTDEFLEEDRAHWDGVKLLAFPSITGDYGFNPRIAQALLRIKPDILHIQGIWSSASVYGRIAAAAGIPTIVAPHGMLDPWILKRSAMKKAAHATLIERPLLNRSIIHALCQSEAESCAAYIPDATDRIFVVPNGIEPPDSPALPPQERNGTLYLGRLHEKKQVLELVRNWAAHKSTAEHTLMIAGWGAPDYEKALQAEIDAHPSIEFSGPAFGEKKQSLLSRARYFILPSLSEGLPMAVLEAISFGAIPIITESCNLPELFLDGTAIKLSEDFSNLDAIYATELFRSMEDISAHSEACRKRSTDYHWDKIAERIQPAYQAAVDLKG